MRPETKFLAPSWRLPGCKQVSDSLWTSVSPPLSAEVARAPLRCLPTPKTPAPPGKVIGSSCHWSERGVLGRGALGFPSRWTLPCGLCQIVSPNPAFLLGRAASSGPQERWPVQPLCLQCSDAAGNLIWADQGGPPHWAQAVSTLISRRLNTASRQPR